MAARRNWTALRRAKVFEAHGGRCHLCGERIDGTREPWELEHIIPLALGGEDDERNVAPAHVSCHRAKTLIDKGNIAKANRVRAKHIGAHVSASPLPGGRKSKWKKKMDGTVVLREDV